MDARPALCTLLLILLGSHNTNGSIKNDEITHIPQPQPHNRNARQDTTRMEQVDSHSHSHSSSHMDPSLIVFFTLDDLKQGNMIPIYFPKRELSDTFPHLLSKQVADSIPFSSEKLHYLLKFFSLSEKSPQAIAMADTLRQCETKHIKGETKLCATSLESMLDFAKSILGSKTEIRILSTTHHLTVQSNKNNVLLLQKYTVMRIQGIRAPKMVACHTMPYPYAVFYCHYQESGTRVYRVSLAGENGGKVEAIAVCHMDTSHWSRNHVSFQVLGIEPGSSPVCHFFPADNFVLVPTTTLMQA